MYDEETEFYYLRSRYYDPYIGRFLNADRLISTGIGLDGYNMFAYCNNNPVFNRDDSGMSMALNNRGILAGPCSASISTGGMGLLSLLSLLFVSAANDTAIPASPPIVKPKTETKSTQIEDTTVATIDEADIARRNKIHMHHIVAKGARDAEPARQVLLKYNIDVLHDPDNLIPLRAEFHWGLHTKAYYSYVNSVITSCNSEAEVRQALNMLKTQIATAEITREVIWTR